jgi:nitroreductase
MEVVEAIRTRRSYGRMTQDRPPREVIERILDAAVCAPNHYLTAPWRFIVLTGEARELLGRAQQVALRQTFSGPDAPEHRAALEKELAKPLRSPVVVVVAVEKSTLEKAVWLEDVCATAAAVQNLLLAAHAEGLAAIWRTGETAYSPEVKEALHLSADAQVLGVVYLGYPDRSQPPAARPPRTAPARWLGWDQ